MKTYTYQIRARYSDTDAMGFVHNSRYLVFLEEARTEFVRHLGYSYARIEEEGIILPIAEAKIKYTKPIKYDELLSIELYLAYLRNHSSKFIYTIRDENNEIKTTGYTVHAALNRETLDFTEIPETLRESLLPYVK